jgi:hypothetical protein
MGRPFGSDERESTLHILHLLAIPRSFGVAESYSAPLSRAATRAAQFAHLWQLPFGSTGRRIAEAIADLLIIGAKT